MQPLGSQALLKAYHNRLTSSHDYDLTVEILNMNEQPLSQAVLVDGQINIQRDAEIRRTGTLTLLDPDRGLGLDALALGQGALFANRMVRVKHYLDVPGFGTVVATPFVGPIADLNRNGSTIDIEVQDKTAFAILGNRPITAMKGENAVSAIVRIMQNRAGENQFRVPAGTKYRLERNYSVGWDDEASPWVVCSKIARAAGLQMLYSCDGYLTLRPRQTTPVFEFGAGTSAATTGINANLTSTPAEDHDFSSTINHARATYGDYVKTATAPSSSPFGPRNPDFMRNGIPRFLPSLAEVDAPNKPNKPGSKRRKASKAQTKQYLREMEKYGDELKSSAAKAQATADALLKTGLSMDENITWSAVPAYHLDVDDVVRVTTTNGSVIIPLSEASIPLLPGEMSGGQHRVIAKPGRIRR